MVDLLLIEVKSRVRATSVQLDLPPKIAVEFFADAQQILLVGISADELINQCAIELIISLFGGGPGLGID